MAGKHTVAMFVQGEDGQRVQVGWASPKDESGVRTFEYSPGYEETRPKDVSFEDDELSQLVAEEQHGARLGDGSDGEDFQVQVEETSDEAEEAEFQRLLAEEEAEKKEQPQTRRELRENEENN